MTRNPDGSVFLTKQEAEVVAGLLTLSRELADQLITDEHDSDLAEQQVLTTLNFLEELGVSPDELIGKLDRRQESR